MRGKLLFVAGAAVGYVVGTRQGREAYEKIAARARKLWSDPRVQKTVADAQGAVKDAVPVVKQKVATATGSAKKTAGEADAGV